ncbi:MAG: glycosyltransferase [Cyclobacteriaceae bacterium]
MKVFVIPSWYPSDSHPSTGIFFKEQAIILAKKRPEWSIGISLWGSHEPKLWVRFSKPLDAMVKRGSKLPLKSKDSLLLANYAEFFTPALTWTRKISNGNMKGIFAACEQNFERYCQYFGKPDIIHAHVSHPAGYVAMLLAGKHHIPYVITEHMSPFPTPSYRLDYKKWIIPPLQKANLVMAVSANLQRDLLYHKIESLCTSNYIDDDEFHLGEEHGGVFTFIAIGRLESQKNYQLMLNAAKVLKATGSQFMLKILGEGSHRGSLKKYIDQNGLAGVVTLMGECTREELRKHLQQSNALINTSLHENQPVAMLEALATGLPIITTAWDGAEDFIKGELGRVVSFDECQLAKEMQNQIASSTPRKDIRQAYVQRYGSDKVIAQLEQAFTQLLD